MKSTVASTQYQLGAAELEVLLAMARTGTLAAAGERLGVDASTVFRAIQRIERGLGQSLFDRSRAGYRPSELAQALAEQAERVEAALEAARSAAQAQPDQVSGTVRISTTDTILHGLIAPALQLLQPRHPALVYELHAGNELVSLTRRDTDIAVRATKRPPQHLVGRQLGMIRSALYAGAASRWPCRTWRPAAPPGLRPTTRCPTTLQCAGARSNTPGHSPPTASTACSR